MLQCEKTQSRQPAWGLAARIGWRAAELRASAAAGRRWRRGPCRDVGL